MKTNSATGAELVCSALEQLGVEVVFGLPGTPTISLYEGLRNSALRTILTGSEQAATFAAGGYFRASGRIAAVSTIPGPGFTSAINGLVEARHDSAAMIILVVKPTVVNNRKFQLQELALEELARPIVKECFEIKSAEQVASVMSEAVSTSLDGEPGPVLVILETAMLTEIGVQTQIKPPSLTGEIDKDKIRRIAERLAGANRPLLFCGQGAADAAESIQRLAEKLSIPVVSTGSGRGVLPEDHGLCLRYDFSGGAYQELNALVAESDLVLAIGCKFTHNGSAGFKLQIEPEKLIHVDTAAEVLGANYPVDIRLQCDAKAFMAELFNSEKIGSADARLWTTTGLAERNSKMESEMKSALPHVPPINGTDSANCADLFRLLRGKVPRDTALITDSGYHQVLARTFWSSLAPRGMIAPSDYQSMGFGLPAAIGAALACPDRRIVAVIGDGSLIVSGMELLTAVREKLSLTILLLNDAGLGQIRMEQFRAYGQGHATWLNTPDVRTWCQSLGVNYFLLGDDFETTLVQALAADGVTLIEADIAGSPGLNRIRRRGQITNKAKKMIGPGFLSRLKRLLGR